MSRRENNNQQVTYDIYVGNVPKNLTETELKQVFVKYGEIKQVLCRWKEEQATGIGYAIVKFVHKADAEKLLRETDEVSWNGHPLPVKAARRSDHNQYNGNSMENKSNCFPDHSSKQILMNPPFLKGPGFFYPGPGPFVNNPIKRHADDYHSMTDIGYFHNSNYQEDQNSASVQVNLEVLCTNAEDAITFYGCPVQRFDQLSNVIHALNSLNLTQNRIDKKPLSKKVYAAMFSEDHSWYRCIVTRTSVPNKPGVCTVRYIDYGNHEDTTYRNVVELPEPLQKVPAFASKFSFLNLICELKSNKQTYLHQLINKRMSLCAIFNPANSEYQVLKCSCNGKDVISETVKKGFASFKNVQRHAGSKPSVAYNKSTSKSNTESLENPMSKVVNYNGSNEFTEEGHLSDSSTNVKKQCKSVSKSKDTSAKNEDINCNEISDDSDFHPKMIIKRGSDLSNIVRAKNSVEVKKEKEPPKQSCVITIDSVTSNLKLINNIRGLVSQSSDDSIIQHAVEILQNEGKALEISGNLSSCLNDAFTNYNLSLTDITNCKDKEILPNLKIERDLKRKSICDRLREFLEKFDTSIFERKKKIMQIIIDLASNTNDWMNVELKAKPSSIEELVLEYNKVKEEKWNLVRLARDKTNEKHAKFMKVLNALKQEFYLNTLEEDGNKCDSSSSNNEGKRRCYAVEFEEALKELGETVDEEIRTLTLNKGKNAVSIIECLLAELDIHKEKVDSICELYESKQKLLNDLCEVIDSDAFITQLTASQAEVCSAFLHLTRCRDSQQGDNIDFQPDLSLAIRDLHIALLKEDSVIEKLSKAAETFLPELCIEYPELKLAEYFQSKFLLKYNWKPEFFLNLERISRGNSSFVSRLLDLPIIIKEYKHESKEDMAKFLQVAFVWNECRCDYLLKITALYFKKENSICVICPLIHSTLLENPPSPVEGVSACNMLRQVLISLKELHSQKLIYGALHPSTVLIENGKVLLDFCFNPAILDGNTIIKGINFRPPEGSMDKFSDMYGFACLVLWLLFPNLSFTSTDEGVPNVAAFRSIIEEALTTKDYSLLCSLISSKPKSRPLAGLLLSKCFLSNYESYCRARNRATNGS